MTANRLKILRDDPAAGEGAARMNFTSSQGTLVSQPPPALRPRREECHEISDMSQPAPADAVLPLGSEMHSGYNARAGVLDIANFPQYLRDNQPRADGGKGPRDPDAPYGREWVAERAKRAFHVQNDAIVSFVSDVNSRVGGKMSNYWTGDAGDNAIMESLVENVIGAGSLTSAASASSPLGDLENLLKSRSAQLREAFGSAFDVGAPALIRKMADQSIIGRGAVSSNNSGSSRRGAQAAATGADESPDLASLSRAQAFQSADYQEELRRLELTRVQRTDQAPPLSAAASAARPGANATSAINPSGAARAVDPYDLIDYNTSSTQNRPYVDTARADSGNGLFRPMAGNLRDAAASESAINKKRDEEDQKFREEVDARRKIASGATGELATVDAQGRVIEGIANPWLSLVRLMYNKPTETELKMWHILFNIPIEKTGGGGSSRSDDLDPAIAQQRKLKNLQLMAMLVGKSSQTGPDWAEAPEHTGKVFFSDRFKGAVRQATHRVRELCGISDILEVDLMVQPSVNQEFADLVAYYLTQTSAVVLRGRTTADATYKKNMDLKKLCRLFTTLLETPEGYLTFQGRADVSSANAQIAAKSLKRRAYTEETGMYFGAGGY